MNHWILFSCLLLSLLIHSTEAQSDVHASCDASGSYTQGSQYETNLNTVLTSLASSISGIDFYNTSFGVEPNDVYGVLQCRGDVSRKDCSACGKTLATDVVKRCPFKKEAQIVNNNCWLYYADYQFFSESGDSKPIVLKNEQGTSESILTDEVQSFLRNLSSTAASAPSRYANDSFEEVNALVQCARDLSKARCSTCLEEHIKNLSDCCSHRRGATVLSVNCFVRIELYRFFGVSSPPTAEAPPPPENPVSDSGAGKENNVRKVLLATLIPFVVISVFVATIYVLLCRRRSVSRKKGRGGQEYWMNPESLVFDLNPLRAATDNFSELNKLGVGGFGPVYKGNLPDGRDIAVKRLSVQSGQGLEELRTEVVLVAKLLHRNLVKLLGFCLEEEEKLLVYEYLPNGSLDQILFDQSRGLLLDWEKRYKIIVGITRGLLYLHEDSQLRIVHRDLKASNILLDKDMTAKISDFGLARLFAESQAQAKTSRIAGTYGYMAPEYIANGHFSTKSDVFSFGVLLLEIVSGRKHSSFESGNLQSYAWRHWTSETALEILDARLGEKYVPRDALKCIQLGLLCVQEDAYDRPTMSQVLLLLNTNRATCPVPSQPAYFVKRTRTKLDASKNSSSILASETGSTTTEMFPRLSHLIDGLPV